MKKILILFSTIAVLLFFSSCSAISTINTSNVNNSTTNVVLSKKNYKVIERVEGHDSSISIFGIGNHGFKTLAMNARADMLRNAKLEGSARAVINEQLEKNTRVIFMVTTKTVSISAYVIEFTE